jgi:hypothetical protein
MELRINENIYTWRFCIIKWTDRMSRHGQCRCREKLFDSGFGTWTWDHGSAKVRRRRISYNSIGSQTCGFYGEDSFRNYLQGHPYN